MKKIIKTIFVGAAQLMFLGFGLIVLSVIYTATLNGLPDPPPDKTAAWIWIDAPAIPMLWRRGWWLNCQLSEPENVDRCTLVTGQTHEVVFAGAYISCDGETSVGQSELQRLLSPKNSKYMWVEKMPNHQLAPAVYLQGGQLLVPAAARSQCGTLKAQIGQAF
jgi:hypothetical protein